MYSQTSTPNNGDPKVEGPHTGTKNKDLELPNSASRPSLVFSASRGPATNNHPNHHRTSNKDKSAVYGTLGHLRVGPQPTRIAKSITNQHPSHVGQTCGRMLPNWSGNGPIPESCPSSATSGAWCSPAPIQYLKLRVAKVTSHCTSPQVQGASKPKSKQKTLLALNLPIRTGAPSPSGR